MQVGLHAALRQVVAQNLGVRGGNVHALQVLDGVVGGGAGHGQAQAALAEPQPFHFQLRETGFHQHVLAHDAQVGHAVLHVAGNIVVAQVQDFEGKVGGFGFELVGSREEADTAFPDQVQGVFT